MPSYGLYTRAEGRADRLFKYLSASETARVLRSLKSGQKRELARSQPVVLSNLWAIRLEPPRPERVSRLVWLE